MIKKKLCLGFGNAILDVIREVNFSFERLKSQKLGSMRLINQEENLEIIASDPSGHYIAGGSVANSISNLAILGNNVAFYGQVGTDPYGDAYEKGMLNLNIQTILSHGPIATGCCHIYVTPDHERTMATYLGAASDLIKTNLSEETLNSFEYILFEGYLLTSVMGNNTIRYWFDKAANNNIKSILSLSDIFVIEHARKNIAYFLENKLTYLFGNKNEFCQLANTSEPQEALRELAKINPELIMICTLSSQGVLIFNKGEITHIPAFNIDNIRDSTGAGDCFVSGFLFGLEYFKNDPEKIIKSAKLGTFFSAQIITQIGARANKKHVTLFKNYLQQFNNDPMDI